MPELRHPRALVRCAAWEGAMSLSADTRRTIQAWRVLLKEWQYGVTWEADDGGHSVLRNIPNPRSFLRARRYHD